MHLTSLINNIGSSKVGPAQCILGPKATIKMRFFYIKILINSIFCIIILKYEFHFAFGCRDKERERDFFFPSFCVWEIKIYEF